MNRVVAQLLTLILTLSFAAASALSPSIAAALDAHKTAEALASRAAKAFEAGNMAEAAGLYREAYHIDASESAYLYGAARAAHTGRDLEHAEQDYVAFLAIPTADPARLQKAKAFLESLRAELSSQKAVDARRAETAGDALLAARLYLEAWRMAPDHPEPLLKAAILERQLGDKSAAIDHLQRYLQLAAADAAGRGTADALLQQLLAPPVAAKVPEPAEVPKPEPVAPAPVAVVVVPPPFVIQPAAAKPISGRRIVGATAVTVGCVALVGAGIVAFIARSQQATLDSNKLSDGTFDGRRITVAYAADQQASINSKWTGTAIGAGAGAVVLGIGVWLLAGAQVDVAIVPSWDRISLAGRF